MKPFAMVKVLFISYLFSACLLLLLAFGLYKFGLSSNKLKIGIMAIYGLSGFLGGFLSGKVSQKKKYIWGTLSGLCYFFILVLISILVNQGFNFEAGNVLLQLALCTGCGMLGGMLA